MKSNYLLDHAGETFSTCFELLKKKNQDYGGKDSNPFKNIENCSTLGISPEQGLLVRMMDKISRVSTLLEKESEIKTESLSDTLLDLINYAAIMKAYIENKQ